MSVRQLRRLRWRASAPASSIRAIERVEADARRVGGHAAAARSRSARDRVRLEHPQLAARRVEHQVDARDAAAAEQPSHVAARAPARAPSASPAARPGRRTSVRADLVARLEVVEVLVVGDRLDDRQRRAVEDRDREVAPGDVALEQDLACRRRTPRPARRARRPRVRANLMPERRALAGGLDDDREARAAPRSRAARPRRRARGRRSR